MNEEDNEQALFVYLRLRDDHFGTEEEREAVFKIEDLFITAIECAGVGEYDGHEFGKGFATMYIYGPSADAMFEIVEPELRRQRWKNEFFAVKRYGEPGAKETRINFPSQ